MTDKPFSNCEELFPTDCEDYSDPFDDSSFLVINNLFSQGSFPRCCNPSPNNTEMEQASDFSENTFSSYEIDEQINHESTSFSQNVINHASSQFSSNASPENFTNDGQFYSTDNQNSSGNVPYFSNLISAPSQVAYTENQDSSPHVPQPATFLVQDCTAISNINQYNINNPQYSCTNPLQKSPNDLQNQVPVHPPQYGHTELQKFNGDYSTSAHQKKTSRKEIYGHGKETEKLKHYKNYTKPYQNCAFYKAIQRKIQGNKYKEEINDIGKRYNMYFKDQIKNKALPKFKRDFTRNLGLAVWFFEELTPYIYQWMVNEKII